MKIFRKIADFQSWRKQIRKKIGFVPTMGALHEGHLALVQEARKERQLVGVSIFVNPTQFTNPQDLKTYPRTLASDLKVLAENKVDFAFAPPLNSMYAKSDLSRVSVSALAENLCGSPRSRGPGHFVGVATVVAKLFNLVRPDRAYFGMKDFQQLRIIEQMNQDLKFGIKIVRCPTVREKDGLALSSRNRRLSPVDRAAAPGLYSALQYGAKLLRSTSGSSPRVVRNKVKSRLDSIPRSRVDYLEIVDPETLKPLIKKRRPALIAAALEFKGARLIDNLLVR